MRVIDIMRKYRYSNICGFFRGNIRTSFLAVLTVLMCTAWSDECAHVSSGVCARVRSDERARVSSDERARVSSGALQPPHCRRCGRTRINTHSMHNEDTATHIHTPGGAEETHTLVCVIGFCFCGH